MVDIQFVEVAEREGWAVGAVGPAQVAAAVREAGFTAALSAGDDDVVPARLVGMSLVTGAHARACRRAAAIRERGVPTIAGGPHATFAPEEVLGSGAFDYVCLGEGEQPLLDLLGALARGGEVRGIPNIWSRGGPRPRIRAPVPDLDRLPFVARDFMAEEDGVVHVLTQRGCPYSCSYCTAGALRQLYRGHRYRRRRSVASVMRELSELGEINYVVFLDDTFTVDPDWLDEFCRAYGQGVGAGFSINAHAETVNPELLRKLADAGCRHAVFGVESGNPRVRRDVLNRRVDDRQIVEAFRWSRRAGIMTTANYMIGLPDEGPSDVEQTLALNARLDPDDLQCFVFYPYPGTRLHDLCRVRGLLPRRRPWPAPAPGESILRPTGLTADELQSFHAAFSELRELSRLRRYGPVFTQG